MNILFLTSHYLPSPSANGMNTLKIVEYLEKKGHKVTCICVANNSEELENEMIGKTEIVRISKSSYMEKIDKEYNKKYSNYILLIKRRFSNLINLYKFPAFDDNQNAKTFDALFETVESKNFDCVISVFKPYANIYALSKLKKIFPNLITIAYLLDFISSIKKPKFFPNRLYKILISNTYKKIEKDFDMILVPENVQSEIGFDKISQSEKINIINFPTFLENIQFEKQNSIVNSPTLNLIYAGTLDKNYRNPEKALVILSQVAQNTKIKINFYGKNNCEEIIEKYRSENLDIVMNGLADHNVIIQKMLDADIVLNISNKGVNAIPSKIFELFSIGKPIINFVESENDVSLEYFRKYPVNLNVFVNEDKNKNIQSIIDFNLTNSKKIIDRDILLKMYEKNLPSYTGNKILNFIGEK